MKVRRIVSSWLTLAALAMLLLGVVIVSQQAAAHPSAGARVAQTGSQQRSGLAHPHAPNATATPCTMPFVDLSGDPYYNAIQYVYCAGAMDGTDASHFSPGADTTRAVSAHALAVLFGYLAGTPTATPCPAASGTPPACDDPPINRGQLAQIIVTALNLPLLTPTGGAQTFTDVPPSNVYYVAIETIAASGIMQGYPDQTFRPNDTVPRDLFCQILYTAVQWEISTPLATLTDTPQASPTATPCPNPFVDISGDPFYSAIQYLYCIGAVDGVDSTHFNPTALASRAFASKAIVVAANLALYTPTSGQDFTDVPPSSPYYTYIETGFHGGVFDSYTQAQCETAGHIYPCFLPDQDITVVELETYIQRAGGYIPVTPGGGSTIQRDEMCQVVYNAFFNPPPTTTITNTPGGPTDTPLPTATPGGPTDTPTATITPGGPTDTPTATTTPSGPTDTPTETPTDCPNPFVDISGNIFYVAIHYLNCRGLVNGIDATHYSPAGTSTRGQFAKVVVLAFNTPLYTPATQDFVDVPPSYFAYLFIESGFHMGILSGFDQATCTANGLGFPCYLPNIPITRGQLTKLVVNAAGYALITPNGGVPDFVDVPPTNVFYQSISTAYAKGIISGYPGHLFLPNNNIRRDEMAQIIYEALQHPGPQR